MYCWKNMCGKEGLGSDGIWKALWGFEVHTDGEVEESHEATNSRQVATMMLSLNFMERQVDESAGLKD